MTAKAPSLVLVVVAVAVVAAGGAVAATAQEAVAAQGEAAVLAAGADASQGGSGALAEATGGASEGGAPEVPPVKVAGKETLTVTGFLSATFFAQDQNFSFGNGQNAEWPTPPQYKTNKWFNGGDVRNTRLTLAFNGPESADGWKVGAVLESDFFGGFNGTGAFSQEQAVPRIRLAYADLTKGSTTLRIGQFWSPLFGETAASLSHIAFPIGYGAAGDVGWRFPGFFLYQGLSSKDAKVKSQLVVAVFEGSWDAPSPITNMSAGNVGFRNQVEARLNFSGKSGGGSPWSVYVVGHWDDKDLTGVNDVNPAGTKGLKSLTGTAAEVGGSYKVGGFLIHGNLYTSKAAGQQFTDITQFGDIKDTGGWLQAGYDIDKRWSIYGFYGMVDANKEDVLKWVGNAGRTKNNMESLMLQWSLGQYQLGLEWLHDEVTLAAGGEKVKGNQIALSTKYVF